MKAKSFEVSHEGGERALNELLAQDITVATILSSAAAATSDAQNGTACFRHFVLVVYTEN